MYEDSMKNNKNQIFPCFFGRRIIFLTQEKTEPKKDSANKNLQLLFAFKERLIIYYKSAIFMESLNTSEETLTQ